MSDDPYGGRKPGCFDIALDLAAIFCMAFFVGLVVIAAVLP